MKLEYLDNCYDVPFNRTIEELKYIAAQLAMRNGNSFNRTIEELKWIGRRRRSTTGSAFNRTIEELK